MRIVRNILIIGISLIASGLKANTPDVNLWKATYPNSTSFTTFSCNVCHTSPPILNGYGQAYKNGGRGNMAALTNIEPLDSDGDGITNIAEITAGSNPGDPTSNPSNIPTNTGGGGGGGGNSLLNSSSNSSADLQNKNMLGNTNCTGRMIVQDSTGIEEIVTALLLFAIPLISVAFLKTEIATRRV